MITLKFEKPVAVFCDDDCKRGSDSKIVKFFKQIYPHICLDLKYSYNHKQDDGCCFLFYYHVYENRILFDSQKGINIADYTVIKSSELTDDGYLKTIAIKGAGG